MEQRRSGFLRRLAGGLRRPSRRKRHFARHSRHFRLRIGTANGAHQPPPATGNRNNFPDGQRGKLFYQLAHGKGNHYAARRCFELWCPHPYWRGCVRDFPNNATLRFEYPCKHTAEIADRISTISVSSTMKVSAEADRLRREGADVVDFGAGEPDFPTPANIKQAAIAR